MKKVLVNGYFGMNFGDDLFFKILFDRYPNTEFNFYNNYYLKKYYEVYKEIFSDYPNVQVKKYNRLRKYFDKLGCLDMANSMQLSQYDANVIIGGSVFMEKSNQGRNAREKDSIYRHFFNKNKPVFILGSNFGPYNQESFKIKYESIFKKCTDVCFREQYSYDLFKDIDSVRLAPDIVFSLKYPKVSKEKDTVGISLIDISHRGDLKDFSDIFEKKIGDLVKKFIDNKKKITFFSFSKEEGDMKAIANVIDKIDLKYKDSINVCNYKGDIDKFLNEFASKENIIGCRFHSVILSQIFNQGVYPLIYSDKTYNVLKDIDLNKNYKYIKDIESLDINKVIEVISLNKIKDKSIHKKAEEQFKILDNYLK